MKPTYPEWVPVEAWEGYVAMRKQIKKPMTEYAQKLAIGKLQDLVMQGQDPKAVLEQSIFNAWQGLFAVKSDPAMQAFAGGRARPLLQLVDQQRANSAEAKRLLGIDDDESRTVNERL